MLPLIGLFANFLLQDIMRPFPPELVCQLEVAARDPFGGPVKDAVFTLDGEAANQSVGRVVTVPCGKHRIAVHAPGFWTKLRDIKVTEQYQYALVSLDMSFVEESEAQTFVRVSIAGYENHFSRCNALKTVPLLSPEKTYDSKVSYRGVTTIPGKTAGPHAFVLIGETGVCGVTVKTIPAFSGDAISLSFPDPEPK
jgi:hypothetical protein